MDALAQVTDLRRLTAASWPDELAAKAALDAASAQVRAYCGWAITSEVNVQVVVDSNGSRLLAVPCLALSAVHEVLAAGHPVTDYTWSAVGVLHRPARWPDGFRSVAVTYSGGHQVVPAELIAVTCGLAGRLSMPMGVAGMSVGSQSVTFSTEAGPGLSAVDQAVLDRYRIVPGD